MACPEAPVAWQITDTSACRHLKNPFFSRCAGVTTFLRQRGKNSSIECLSEAVDKHSKSVSLALSLSVFFFC